MKLVFSFFVAQGKKMNGTFAFFLPLFSQNVDNSFVLAIMLKTFIQNIL